MANIIDRRPANNSDNKSLSNHQRFMERAKHVIRDMAHKAMGKRSMDDKSDQSITVPSNDINEPRFTHSDSTGENDRILPGNKEFSAGDKIKKPKKGGGDGGSGDGDPSKDGESTDDFKFVINYEEYLNLIFDDLELPDLIKKSQKSTVSFSRQRAGHSNYGNPSNLNIEKTMISGISRRIALKTPKLSKIAELLKELETETDEDRRKEIEEEISVLRKRANAISFLDDVDLRYNNFKAVPKPQTSAVMFCVMDVSASMGEREKFIAKKFFLLLQLFLSRKYKGVEVVFIRHHETASECDETDFFTSQESGGTAASTAYALTEKIIQERYPAADWNIYVANVSDGDNFSSDTKECVDVITRLAPQIQYLTYLEVTKTGYYMEYYAHDSSLLSMFKDLSNKFSNIAFGSVIDDNDIVIAFRKFFEISK
jgi:uncharacterized sporulation protein YeaH/YhbH (DUF444 family)